MSRPLIPRQTKGYKTDLAALARIRSGTLTDNRITEQAYKRITDAIGVIERELRRLPEEKEGE